MFSQEYLFFIIEQTSFIVKKIGRSLEGGKLGKGIIGVLIWFFPEMDFDFDFNALRDHHSYDVSALRCAPFFYADCMNCRDCFA